MAHPFDALFALKDEGKSISEIAERHGMDRRKVKLILESLDKEREYRPYSLTDLSKWDDIKARIEEMHKLNKETCTWQVIRDIKEKFDEQV